MEKRRIFKSTIFAFLSAVLLIFPVLVGSVRAAGLWAYELGTPDMGTASAGRGAIAGDASVALFNAGYAAGSSDPPGDRSAI